MALGRKNHALFIAAANLWTSILCAAFFFGEGRYHVPYDPFAVLLAVVGCYEVARRVRRWLSRRRHDREEQRRAHGERPAGDAPGHGEPRPAAFAK